MTRFNTIIFSLSLVMGALGLSAQNDVLFNLDFEQDPSMTMADFPDPGNTDSLWVNYDEDGLDTSPGDPSNFHWGTTWISEDTNATGELNNVFRSVSWLQNFDPTSSNWLISPAMNILDANATLHWKSAPYQGPAYMDGYTVKILRGSQDVTSPDIMVDTVYQVAEMISIVAGDGGTVELDSFEFSDGYIHADGYMLPEYFIPADLTQQYPIHTGILEPHSISLAQYEGQTIYVAWHHDSSDDNILMIDDLLLMGTLVSGTENQELTDLRFVTYPNPVDNFLNVMFKLKEPANVQIEIFSQDGKRVALKTSKQAVSGDFTQQFDLRNIPSGTYAVVLSIDNQRFTKTIIRK